MRKFTRREFLTATAGSLAALKLGSFLGWMPDGIHSVRAEPLPSVVTSTGTKEDSAEKILRTALDNLGGISRFVKPGQVVVIKPNATWAYPPHTASSSDPDLLTALINMVKEAGASRIIVMDHCSIEPGTAESLRMNKLGDVVKATGVEGSFPDRFNAPKSLFEKIELPKGVSFQKLGVIKAAIAADVRINLALAKSHSVTRFTMCLKHMMGFLENPGSLHSHLSQGIADLSTDSPIKADLHILEAILVRVPYGDYNVCAGPETETSNPYVIHRHNQIIAGTDPVLMDAFGCVNYFKIKPKELAHVKLAADIEVGEMDLEKATSEGRIKMVNAGDVIVLTSTPTVKPDVMEVTSTPTVLGPAPTATPLPTAVALNQLMEESSAPADSVTSCQDVIDIRKYLGGALLPVALIAAGIGLAVMRDLRKTEEKKSKDGNNEPPLA
jgi:uncharacterized protein (DUF362 family)